MSMYCRSFQMARFLFAAPFSLLIRCLMNFSVAAVVVPALPKKKRGTRIEAAADHILLTRRSCDLSHCFDGGSY